MADIIAPPTDQPVNPAPTPTSSTVPATPERERPAQVQHTPGGVPATPLALLTANTAVATSATLALTAGWLLAVLAAGGAATVTAIGGRVRRRRNERHRGAAAHQSGMRGFVPRPRTRLGGSGMSASRRAGFGRRAAAGGLHGQPAAGGRGRSAAGIRGLRQQHRAALPSRSARRMQRTADRHQVADQRRHATRQARRQHATSRRISPRALAARIATSPKAAARQAKRDTARVTQRAQRAQTAGSRVADKRKELRRTPVRRNARWRLLRSAARCHTRRAGNSLLALPVMLLGTLTTALGRKLGFPSWMYPGHRLLRWLNGRARQAQETRDQQIREDLADGMAAVDAAEEKAAKQNGATPAPAKGLGSTVARAPLSHNANTNLGVDLTTAAGFNFADAAVEMEAAAQSFDPDGMMQVLAAFESMPEAMHCIARTFQILAERSDAEFPLEKEVGEALNDVFQQLQQAIGACEELGTTMRRVHEQDIRRHEDPRNGEDKWDTGNNN